MDGMDVGLLLVRLGVGAVLAPHGLQKLFGWFGGPGVGGTAQYLRGHGFRPAKLHAIAAGLSEFGGGLLVALGLLTPLGAAVMAGTMIVAMASVAGKRGFFANTGGIEFPLALCLGALAVAFTGPGDISVDALFGIAYHGTAWGLGAVALALIAAGGTLATRLGGKTVEPDAVVADSSHS
ncbi:MULTISPECIES: DoxX family protein [unclassified Kribbella]|uniref:DoxX family protein n=1 Tax=unclassified Kribbella TaxID=2644121 RepID=UPI0033F488FA